MPKIQDGETTQEMNEQPLVSAIIPTRKRLLRLIKTVESMRNRADNPDCIEFVLKIDEDDMETQLGFPWHKFPTARKVISPRGRGYVEMGRFVTEALNAATGKWGFLIDDDCWIYRESAEVTRGWDTLLREVPDRALAQCEFYHLGGSLYGPGSCGVVGPIFPMEVWKNSGIAELPSPADDSLCGYFVRTLHYPVHLLKGYIYRHNRDTEEQLAAQALL